MREPPLSLNEEALDDLAEMLRHIELIEESMAIATTQPPTAGILAFSARVAAKMNREVKAVYDALYGISNIKRIQQNRSINEERVLDLLTEALDREADRDWKENYSRQWHDARPILLHALSEIGRDHPLMVSHKAHSLAYTHQNLFLSGRLITDVRPVFDEAAEHILETVITHTLTINYSDANQEFATMSFALDADDVQSVIEICNRAVAKGRVTLHAMRNLNPVLLPDQSPE